MTHEVGNSFEEKAREIVAGVLKVFDVVPRHSSEMDTAVRIITPALAAALREVREQALEDAALEMERKFHKVSERPTYHPDGPGETRSPFADAIRALKREERK